MNRSRLGAALVVLAILGAGWWWRRAHREPPPAAAVTAPSPPAGAGARPGRPDRGAELGPTRVLIDDDPPGALRLEGQVIDADEHGVAGALVVLAANPSRTVLTQADGGFAFDGLIGRPYTLVARAAKGIAGPVTTRLTEKSDPVVLRLRPAGTLTVTVVGLQGKPIEGATVELRGLDVQRATVAAGRGAAVFSPVVPGTYQIAAWADGMAHAFHRIQIGSGDAAVRMVLASGAPVSGRVVDDQGTGVAGAHVRSSGASDWSQQASDRFDAVVTGSDGSFELAALPAGSFRFVATHPERAPGTSPLITLDGKTPRTGVVIALAIGATIRGHVVDRQHQPVGSARVRIGATGGPRGNGLEAPRQAYSDAQGRFEIKGLPRKPLAAVALHETGSSQTVAVDATSGEVAEVTLAIDQTGSISGHVVDPQGQPVEGAQVSAGPSFGVARGAFDPSGWQLRGLPQDTSDAAGHFTLTGLAPGQYRVAAAPQRAQGPLGPLGMFGGGRRGGTRAGVTATTGDTDVKLVLAPDGGVKGAVAFAGGGVPELFSVGTQAVQQSFGGGDGAFTLEGLAPGTHQLEVRGPSFQTIAVEVVIEPSKLADAGTIRVVKGRTIAGVVVADGRPVPDATVYAGRTVLGNGTTTAGQLGPAGAAISAATKSTTTDDAGAFSLAGFNDGDITLVAEHPELGRSRALRLPTVMPGQTELTINLEKFSALHGTLHQDGAATGTLVTCQSTSTPGAVFTVMAGGDGAYRFDRLAPDTYKVSATLGTPRSGMHFYSKQIDLPPGADLALDLSVDAGDVTLDVTLLVTGPGGGSANAALAWLASGALTAQTEGELARKVAAAGPGAYQRVVARGGVAELTRVTPGGYTICVTPLPLQVQGQAILGYLDRHGDALPAFCQAVTVAATPATQAAQVPVTLPALISDGPDAPGGGSGAGPGPGSGSGH